MCAGGVSRYETHIPGEKNQYLLCLSSNSPYFNGHVAKLDFDRDQSFFSFFSVEKGYFLYSYMVSKSIPRPNLRGREAYPYYCLWEKLKLLVVPQAQQEDCFVRMGIFFLLQCDDIKIVRLHISCTA